MPGDLPRLPQSADREVHCKWTFLEQSVVRWLCWVWGCKAVGSDALPAGGMQSHRAWGSSHLKSRALDPTPGLCGIGRQNSTQARALLTFGLTQKVPNNNSASPSMKKETHCVYRYRAWPPKQESTFGSGAPGQGCWTAAPLLWVLRPTRFLSPQPDLKRWAGRSKPTLSSQTQPCLTPQLRPGENSLWESARPAQLPRGRKLLLTPIHRNPSGLNPDWGQICHHCYPDMPGENGTGHPLYFSPQFVVGTEVRELFLVLFYFICFLYVGHAVQHAGWFPNQGSLKVPNPNH